MKRLKSMFHFCFIMFTLYQPSGIFGQSYEQLEARIRLLELRVKKLEQLLENSLTEESIPSSNFGFDSSSLSKHDDDFYSGPNIQQTPSQESNESDPNSSSVIEVSDNRITVSKQILSNLIRARILKKTIQSTNGGNAISLLIAFTNTDPKDIVSLKGTVTVTDLFENILTRFFIHFERKIASYESEAWFGEVPYDPTNEDYKMLFSMNAEELKTSFEPTEIVYTDGFIKTAE